MTENHMSKLLQYSKSNLDKLSAIKYSNKPFLCGKFRINSVVCVLWCIAQGNLRPLFIICRFQRICLKIRNSQINFNLYFKKWSIKTMLQSRGSFFSDLISIGIHWSFYTHRPCVRREWAFDGHHEGQEWERQIGLLLSKAKLFPSKWQKGQKTLRASALLDERTFTGESIILLLKDRRRGNGKSLFSCFASEKRKRVHKGKNRLCQVCKRAFLRPFFAKLSSVWEGRFFLVTSHWIFSRDLGPLPKVISFWIWTISYFELKIKPSVDLYSFQATPAHSLKYHW